MTVIRPIGPRQLGSTCSRQAGAWQPRAAAARPVRASPRAAADAPTAAPRTAAAPPQQPPSRRQLLLLPAGVVAAASAAAAAPRRAAAAELTVVSDEAGVGAAAVQLGDLVLFHYTGYVDGTDTVFDTTRGLGLVSLCALHAFCSDRSEQQVHSSARQVQVSLPLTCLLAFYTTPAPHISSTGTAARARCGRRRCAWAASHCRASASGCRRVTRAERGGVIKSWPATPCLENGQSFCRACADAIPTASLQIPTRTLCWA